MSDRRLTITVEEAGRQLGISRARAYESARVGEIPTIRMGRRLLVPIAALEGMLTGQPKPALAAEEKPAPRRRYRTRARRGSPRPDRGPA